MNEQLRTIVVSFPKENWTYIFVTAITILIWFWAAGETRETQTFDNAPVEFVIPGLSDWIIDQSDRVITIEVEGPVPALEEMETMLRRPLKVPVTATVGKQSISLRKHFSELSEIRELGVTVTATEPEVVDIEIDQIEDFNAEVKPVLPGISTEGELVVEPPEVTVAMPSQLRQTFADDLIVEAFIERGELNRLQPGVSHSREVRLRLPGRAVMPAHVVIKPSKAKVTFTIRSRTRETTLATIPIQLAETSLDSQDYRVEIEPTELQKVTVSGDADLIRQIELKRATVAAVLNLTRRELELQIDSKPISYFVALVPQFDGSVRGLPVEVRVGDTDEKPLITLRIEPRVSR